MSPREVPPLTDWSEVASGAALFADGRTVPTAPINDRFFAFVLDTAGVDPWTLPIPYRVDIGGRS